MPSTGFDAFANDLDRLGQSINGGKAMRAITTNVGVKAKKVMEDAAARAVGADLRFSGWGRAKLGSGFELDSDHSFELRGRPAGMWVVATDGRKRGAKAPKRSRRKILDTPKGPRTFTRAKPLTIGGTRGKGAWTKGVALIAKSMPEWVEEELDAHIRKTFGGR